MTHATAARISPESRPVAFAAAGLAAAIYLGAFAASFFGLASLAAFMAVPVALQYVVPAVIDLALILFTLATLLRRARGLSTWKTNTATAFWILVSMAANTFHVLVAAGPASSWGVGTYAGATLSALMPLSALGASLVLENLLIEDPKPAAAVDPAADVTPVAAAVEPTTLAPALPEPVRTALHAVPQEPAASVTRPSVLASVPTTSKGRPAAGDPKSVWAAATQREQAALAQGLRSEGKSIPQIAAEFGTSVATVKRRLPSAA